MVWPHINKPLVQTIIYAIVDSRRPTMTKNFLALQSWGAYGQGRCSLQGSCIGLKNLEVNCTHIRRPPAAPSGPKALGMPWFWPWRGTNHYGIDPSLLELHPPPSSAHRETCLWDLSKAVFKCLLYFTSKHPLQQSPIHMLPFTRHHKTSPMLILFSGVRPFSEARSSVPSKNAKSCLALFQALQCKLVFRFRRGLMSTFWSFHFSLTRLFALLENQTARVRLPLNDVTKFPLPRAS